MTRPIIWKSAPGVYSFRIPNIRLSLIFAFYRTLSGLIALLLLYLWPYRREVIRKNLAGSFPEMPETERRGIQKRYLKHVADLVSETFLITHLKRNELTNVVQFENISLLKNLIQSGNSIVLMASHYGNWEYLRTLPMLVSCDVYAAYAPLSNRFLNSKLLNIRGKHGARLIPKNDWLRKVLMHGGDPSVFVTIADQRPVVPGRAEVSFLNQKTHVQAGPELIARKLNCAVVYMDVVKIGKNKYRYRFDLISVNGKTESPESIMYKYYVLLEQTIRRKPEYWLWSHNRWKYT
ncbi:Lipid A biosynthesis lauroyltransferase [Dyadobacter sp. CECT 9275]|uniref:Lipid A biosynthesis lauroyltransferase n=1 Tax=Dyadobacter helix TaxID=2822344 RepID=A0A916JJ50_9BACT|nr:lysophospholipid acyltransferase family protein [Dyadobacter sp. CECT 9275]CAG5018081.1 Lipid A biosynthesis lauroyltransferase [Dyadobacter sp. CECT 9275]